jgi:hypothetical protein
MIPIKWLTYNHFIKRKVMLSQYFMLMSANAASNTPVCTFPSSNIPLLLEQMQNALSLSLNLYACNKQE